MPAQLQKTSKNTSLIAATLADAWQEPGTILANNWRVSREQEPSWRTLCNSMQQEDRRQKDVEKVLRCFRRAASWWTVSTSAALVSTISARRRQCRCHVDLQLQRQDTTQYHKLLNLWRIIYYMYISDKNNTNSDIHDTNVYSPIE